MGIGTNCPVCRDRVTNCKYVRGKCSFSYIRRYCPITCNVNCQERQPCFDDKHQAPMCPFFKASGFCELDPELMRTYCKRTCQLCDGHIHKPTHRMKGTSPNSVEDSESMQ